MELEITDQNFDSVVAQGKPVVVDFWATWCGPCKRLAPMIEELAAEYDGKVSIGKCDIEENTDMTDKFGIMNVPTVVFIRDGKEIDRLVGIAGKNVYQEKINSML
ncbi:MAG: thioredoxin [Bacteroidaceae bacterium]|nr:thioredoxin [Candidatus Colenecus caballi]MCQ2073361.1 thioredoxin [Bacteroidaceae bacterium]